MAAGTVAALCAALQHASVLTRLTLPQCGLRDYHVHRICAEMAHQRNVAAAACSVLLPSRSTVGGSPSAELLAAEEAQQHSSTQESSLYCLLQWVEVEDEEVEPRSNWISEHTARRLCLGEIRSRAAASRLAGSRVCSQLLSAGGVAITDTSVLDRPALRACFWLQHVRLGPAAAAALIADGRSSQECGSGRAYREEDASIPATTLLRCMTERAATAAFAVARADVKAAGDRSQPACGPGLSTERANMLLAAAVASTWVKESAPSAPSQTATNSPAVQALASSLVNRAVAAQVDRAAPLSGPEDAAAATAAAAAPLTGVSPAHARCLKQWTCEALRQTQDKNNRGGSESSAAQSPREVWQLAQRVFAARLAAPERYPSASLAPVVLLQAATRLWALRRRQQRWAAASTIQRAYREARRRREAISQNKATAADQMSTAWLRHRRNRELEAARLIQRRWRMRSSNMLRYAAAWSMQRWWRAQATRRRYHRLIRAARLVQHWWASVRDRVRAARRLQRAWRRRRAGKSSGIDIVGLVRSARVHNRYFQASLSAANQAFSRHQLVVTLRHTVTQHVALATIYGILQRQRSQARRWRAAGKLQRFWMRCCAKRRRRARLQAAILLQRFVRDIQRRRERRAMGLVHRHAARAAHAALAWTMAIDGGSSSDEGEGEGDSATDPSRHQGQGSEQRSQLRFPRAVYDELHGVELRCATKLLRNVCEDASTGRLQLRGAWRFNAGFSRKQRAWQREQAAVEAAAAAQPPSPAPSKHSPTPPPTPPRPPRESKTPRAAEMRPRRPQRSPYALTPRLLSSPHGGDPALGLRSRPQPPHASTAPPRSSAPLRPSLRTTRISQAAAARAYRTANGGSASRVELDTRLPARKGGGPAAGESPLQTPRATWRK